MRKIVVIGIVLVFCIFIPLASAGFIDDIYHLFAPAITAQGNDLNPMNVSTPEVIVQYDGDTPISDALANGVLAQSLYTINSKIAKPPKGYRLPPPEPADPATILKQATDEVMSSQDYPYDITNGNTTITINSYSCNDDTQLCGYWIHAIRDGSEVATNSPIWISPPPYQVVESDVTDTIANTETITLKEDPFGAVNNVLQRYVDMQPLGNAVIGTQPP